MTKIAYSWVTASAWFIALIVISSLVFSKIFPKVTVRDKEYIKKLFSSNYYGEPSPTREHLVASIVGPAAESQHQVFKEVSNLIDENIKPIKDFLDGDEHNKKTLYVQACWGAGKTTSLLIAINESKKEDNRYVYEAAFKYRGNVAEFIDDVLHALEDTMHETGIKTGWEIESLIKNLDPDARKTFINFIKKHYELNDLSSDLVLRLNQQYKKSRKKVRIFIIIDDLDRLQGADIAKILSFLSILRKLQFIKIIIPADSSTIVEALDKADIVKAPIFVEKYLPSQMSVKIKSGFDMMETVILNKIICARSNQNKNLETACPALAAVLMGLLARELAQQTRGLELVRYRWLRSINQELPNNSGEKLAQLLRAPRIAVRACDKFRQFYTWAGEYNNITKFQNIVFALKRKNGAQYDSINQCFSDSDYENTIEPWIFTYVEKRWGIFRFSVRDVLDILESVDYDRLPDRPAAQFAHIFNQLFPDSQLACSNDASSDSAALA